MTYKSCDHANLKMLVQPLLFHAPKPNTRHFAQRHKSTQTTNDWHTHVGWQPMMLSAFQALPQQLAQRPPWSVAHESPAVVGQTSCPSWSAPVQWQSDQQGGWPAGGKCCACGWWCRQGWSCLWNTQEVMNTFSLLICLAFQRVILYTHLHKNITIIMWPSRWLNGKAPALTHFSPGTSASVTSLCPSNFQVLLTWSSWFSKRLIFSAFIHRF